MKIVAAVIACAVLAAGAASAAERVQDVPSFPLWCAEVKNHKAQRCDAQIKEDLDEYDAYVANYDRYKDEPGIENREREVLQRVQSLEQPVDSVVR